MGADAAGAPARAQSRAGGTPGRGGAGRGRAGRGGAGSWCSQARGGASELCGGNRKWAAAAAVAVKKRRREPGPEALGRVASPQDEVSAGPAGCRERQVPGEV